MKNSRTSGLALIAGTAATMLTMLLHPTGHDLFAASRYESMALRSVLAHGLALAGLPLVFLGALGLTRRLAASETLGLLALVTLGFALEAVMNAAILSGLVSTRLIGTILDVPAAESTPWKVALHLSGSLNQAYAQVHVVASSLAIALWSVALVRERGLARAAGGYGLGLAALTLLGLFSGHVRLDVHGFGAIVLGQALWYVACGAWLWRTPRA